MSEMWARLFTVHGGVYALPAAHCSIGGGDGAVRLYVRHKRRVSYPYTKDFSDNMLSLGVQGQTPGRKLSTTAKADWLGIAASCCPATCTSRNEKERT